MTSNLCCQHGCNSDAERCDDAECRAKAKQAYVHTLRNPGSATAHEGLERCPGPRTDICRPWPIERPAQAPDTSKEHMKIVQQALYNLREATQAEHLRRNDVSIYWCCSHGGLALAKAGGHDDAYIGDTPLRLPRTLHRPLGISRHPAPSTRTPQTWKTFVAGASLSMRCVRASGDWVFVPLASLGLCDHAFSPAFFFK